MNTPICDFVRAYREKAPLRLHMPGHKGAGPLGFEGLDITEVAGADSLYEASGIIRESEENASRLFACPTLYSTEGSSQCIRAMLYLARLYATGIGRAPRILAARNAHKTLIGAAALLDVEIDWMYPEREDSYLSLSPSPTYVQRCLEDSPHLPAALYLTSPDYLGTLCDVEAIATVCHRYGVMLLVDNAHGAYLHFLPEAQHPIDLGADLACDSAHKTLPVLTGGAYLHLSPTLPAPLCAAAREAMALFGSTSPSYLILQSLDAVNPRLEHELPEALEAFLPKAAYLWSRLRRNGLRLRSDEPLKLTVCAKPYGYTGDALADELRARGIECEFSDPDYVVLMLSPLAPEALPRIEQAFLDIPRRDALTVSPPPLPHPAPVLSPREALLARAETVRAADAEGRILASPSLSCPPAVPLVVSGERIDQAALAAFSYWGIQAVRVVKE